MSEPNTQEKLNPFMKINFLQEGDVIEYNGIDKKISMKRKGEEIFSMHFAQTLSTSTLSELITKYASLFDLNVSIETKNYPPEPMPNEDSIITKIYTLFKERRSSIL